MGKSLGGKLQWWCELLDMGHTQWGEEGKSEGGNPPPLAAETTAAYKHSNSVSVLQAMIYTDPQSLLLSWTYSVQTN